MKIKADKMCELEKCGYKYNERYNIFFKCLKGSDCSLDIYIRTREIKVSNYSTADMNCCHDEVLEEFYKLIKADMVEKDGE